MQYKNFLMWPLPNICVILDNKYYIQAEHHMYILNTNTFLIAHIHVSFINTNIVVICAISVWLLSIGVVQMVTIYKRNCENETGPHSENYHIMFLLNILFTILFIISVSKLKKVTNR